MMEGDIMVKFDLKIIYLLKYFYELKVLFMFYYEVSFVGIVEKVVMKYGVGIFWKILSC